MTTGKTKQAHLNVFFWKGIKQRENRTYDIFMQAKDMGMSGVVSPFGCPSPLLVALVDQNEITGEADVTSVANKNQRGC